MKTILVSALFVCAAGSAAAQELGTGTHVYTSDLARLEITVGDDSWSQQFTFQEASGYEDKGEGMYREAGDVFWYELHGETCNFEFDDPSGDASHIVVSIYDCNNGEANRKMELRLSE
jgi:hypothetical protein